jgi:hypothetical protein
MTSATNSTLLAETAKSRSVSAWATILFSKHNQVPPPSNQLQAPLLLKAVSLPLRTLTETNLRCSADTLQQ